MKFIPDVVKFEMLYQYLEAGSHSDAIINYLGHMIDDSKVAYDSIEINLIEKNWQTDEWEIKKSTFDKEGYLVNWSLGFFDWN